MSEHGRMFRGRLDETVGEKLAAFINDAIRESKKRGFTPVFGRAAQIDLHHPINIYWHGSTEAEKLVEVLVEADHAIGDDSVHDWYALARELIASGRISVKE